MRARIVYARIVHITLYARIVYARNCAWGSVNVRSAGEYADASMSAPFLHGVASSIAGAFATIRSCRPIAALACTFDTLAIILRIALSGVD